MDSNKKTYNLSLPLKGEPSKRFKQFTADLNSGGFLALAENWKGRLRFNSYSMPSSTGDTKKTGRESSIVAKATEEEISQFASSFNVAMSLKRDRSVTLKAIPLTSHDNLTVEWTLKLTVSITSLPARMVFENFLALAKSN